MNARIKATGILGFLFFVVSVIYYEFVIQIVTNRRPGYLKIKEYRDVLLTSSNEQQILETLEKVNGLSKSMENETLALYNEFSVIQILCILNLTYLIQHVITFIVTKKLGRFYEFPALIHITDAILFVSSVFVIDWFVNRLQSGLMVDPLLSKEEFTLRLQSNIVNNIDYPFQYQFSA